MDPTEELRKLVEALTSEIKNLKAEINRLSAAQTERRTEVLSVVSEKRKAKKKKLGRKQFIKNLAVGVAAGASMASVIPNQTTQARIISGDNPGALIVPTGATTTGSLGPSEYGLIASADDITNFNDATLVSVFSDTSGVLGIARSFNANGVVGIGNSPSNFDSIPAGVWGLTDSSGGIALLGSASGDKVIGIAIDTSGPDSTGLSVSAKGSGAVAGEFLGNVTISTGNDGSAAGDLSVNGTLTKSGGAFKIDHPLDPTNKYLYHSFVESPDMKNIYDGIVSLDDKGEAEVELPGWFEVLNKDFRYQLTSLEIASPTLHISRQINTLKFKIGGGQSGQQVSWQVTGIRQDKWANANRIAVEEMKMAKDKGQYLHPGLYGQSEEKQLGRLDISQFSRKKKAD